MLLRKLPPANRDKVETTPTKTEDTMANNNTMTRILGGSPLAVLWRRVRARRGAGVLDVTPASEVAGGAA